jgi:hypothetical protein
MEDGTLLHACWSVCEHLSSFSSLPGADPCLKRASRLKRTRDEWHLLEEKAGRVGRVYRQALTELEWMQVQGQHPRVFSDCTPRTACRSSREAPQNLDMICGCAVQRKVQRAMAAKDMQDKAQRVESRCIALLHPLRFAQEEHGASRSDGRGCSRTARRVGVAQETDADVRCNALPTMEGRAVAPQRGKHVAADCEHRPSQHVRALAAPRVLL